jgi:hypothetical protein
MVSQLLFGEVFELLEASENNKWLRVRLHFDHYEGWIDALQATPLQEDYYHAYTAQLHPVCSSPYALLRLEQGIVPITMGASLPFYESGSGHINTAYYWYEEGYRKPEAAEAESLLAIAQSYLHSPYLWGGRSLWGIDCSGFVQQVFKTAGYQLQRDAYQQAEQGHLLRDLSQAQAGDLAFFERDGRIIHVGILLEPNKIIHARGAVRIDPFDAQGILDEAAGVYSHQLAFVRNIINQ